MATKKLQILTKLRPTDEKIQSAVDEFFVDHPISSSVLDKLCRPFEASGQIVTCNPVEGYPLEVEWETKNLVVYPHTDTTKTVNGITFTDNGDGTVTANGTATANAVFNLGVERTWALKPGADYTASIKQASGTVTGTPRLSVSYFRPGASGINYIGWLSADVNKATTKPCPNDYSTIRAYILIPSGVVCTDLVLACQLEKGTTATVYEPYAETATQITRCGKNLCTVDTAELINKSMDVVLWSGSLSAPLVLRAKVSDSEFATPSSTFIQLKIDGEARLLTPVAAVNGYKITSGTLTEVRLYNWCGGTGIANFQLETGTTATDFEPYNGGTFAPGEPIPALSGVNTIFADVGLVTVSGRADPNYVIDTLLDRVAALEATAVNNT